MNIGEQPSQRRAQTSSPVAGPADRGAPVPGAPADTASVEAPERARPLSTPDSTTPFQTVGFTVSTIGYAVARDFRAILEPLGLEPREFALLRAVSASEGQTQNAIAERLQIPPSRMVAFVDALEARGLLERRHDPTDRRTRALHLTDDGRELLVRAFVLALGHEQNICADLSDEERSLLLALLQRVAVRVGLAPGVHAAHAALADE